MAGSSIGFNPNPEHRPGPMEVRRYEDYEEEEEDDWN